MDYHRPIRELVRARRACRTYDRVGIPSGKRQLLERACSTTVRGLRGERMHFQLVDAGAASGVGPVSFFAPGARFFLVGAVEDVDAARVSYGFRMEELVLKATDVDLGTCWLGMFDPARFPGVRTDPGEIVPAVSAVGQRAARPRLLESVIRLVIAAGSRQPWKRLFFDGTFDRPLVPSDAGPYAEPLEMVRWAPSAGNRQPWRVVKESAASVFHFFARPTRRAYIRHRLHELDLGIAMCHFELSARENGREGRWVLRQAQDVVLREGREDILRPAEDHVLRPSQGSAARQAREMVYIATWLDSRGFSK